MALTATAVCVFSHTEPEAKPAVAPSTVTPVAVTPAAAAPAAGLTQRQVAARILSAAATEASSLPNASNYYYSIACARARGLDIAAMQESLSHTSGGAGTVQGVYLALARAQIRVGDNAAALQSVATARNAGSKPPAAADDSTGKVRGRTAAANAASGQMVSDLIIAGLQDDAGDSAGAIQTLTEARAMATKKASSFYQTGELTAIAFKQAEVGDLKVRPGHSGLDYGRSRESDNAELSGAVRDCGADVAGMDGVQASMPTACMARPPNPPPCRATRWNGAAADP